MAAPRRPGVAPRGSRGVGRNPAQARGRLGGGAMHGADAGLVVRGARSLREAGESVGLVSEKRVAEVRRETGRARSAGLASATGFGGVRAHLARRRVGCLLWAVPRGSVAVEHVVEIHVVEAPRAPVLRARGSNICATHGAICYRQPPRRVVVRARLAARGEGRRRSEGTLRTFARALVMSSARAETPLAMNAAGQARPPRPTDATRENFGRSSRRRKIPSGPLVGNRGICISHPTLPLSKRRSRDRSKPVRRAVSLSIPPRPGFTFRFNRARRRARPTFRPVDPPPPRYSLPRA